ncbi:MAG: spermidine synthase, partial [Comamonadaceae bacterium]
MDFSEPGPAAAARRRRIAVLYAIFLLSGFCGLIYESIWSHYLKMLLGHAAYAQAVVLVVFVGGLALGASIVGHFSERIRHPVIWYAVVEAAVALMAFAFQGVFEKASWWATSSFLPAACGSAPGSCSAAWLLAAALILPPSILLGTTFPLMSAGVIRLGVAPGRGLSLLYFLNSTGAAAGVLASGFLLIPAFGLPGTILLAGACNVFVALAAYLAVRVRAGSAPAPQGTAALPQPAGGAPELRLLLAVAALTGLSSFVYEVVWIRMLSLVLGAATHAFELMLAPFIFGLAIGAWWIRNRIDTSRDAMLLLARIQVVMGLLAVSTLPLYASLYDGMSFA